jgi:NAD(P)-dependent dehydrogenase (short-subunit alcohol dehydrogenase family)
MMSDVFSYSGKRVAIVGCFSGMGESCARRLIELGAEVHGFDIKPSPVNLASFTQVDLKDWASIDAAVGGFSGRIDALFNCAGLAQTFPALDVVRVNFLGIRHWTEAWIDKLKDGGAIASISSLAGMGYAMRQPILREFMAIADEAHAIFWLKAHPDDVADGYTFSKDLLNTWTQLMAVKLAARQIRVNATLPSSTLTPMMDDFRKIAPDAILNAYTVPIGRFATASEQADPLVFLNSDAARFVSGICLPVDHGFMGGVTVGEFDPAKMIEDAFADAAQQS